jgi:hypothetical protein
LAPRPDESGSNPILTFPKIGPLEPDYHAWQGQAAGSDGKFIYYFEVLSTYSTLRYDSAGKAYRQLPIVYRFALDFSAR